MLFMKRKKLGVVQTNCLEITMNSFLNYLSLISLGLTVYSGFRMLQYLYKRGKEKSALYSFNPLFFLDYIKITRNETKKTGIWFKIFLVSFIITIISGIAWDICSTW
jgi:hypothetical protein